MRCGVDCGRGRNGAARLCRSAAIPVHGGRTRSGRRRNRGRLHGRRACACARATAASAPCRLVWRRWRHGVAWHLRRLCRRLGPGDPDARLRRHGDRPCGRLGCPPCAIGARRGGRRGRGSLRSSRDAVVDGDGAGVGSRRRADLRAEDSQDRPFGFEAPPPIIKAQVASATPTPSTSNAEMPTPATLKCTQQLLGCR
jgi:hypothetical protein